MDNGYRPDVKFSSFPKIELTRLKRIEFKIAREAACYNSYSSQTCLNLFRFTWIVRIQYDVNSYNSYDSQTINMSKLVLIFLWKCKDNNENARTKMKMQGRHKKLFLGSLRESRAIKKFGFIFVQKFEDVTEQLIHILRQSFTFKQSQHLKTVWY